MIRNMVLISSALLFMASCAKNNGFSTTQVFAPAKFEVSDVYVNMTDGIENSNRVRKLMKNAGINTADKYNETMTSAHVAYPLEIEVNEINYGKPDASASSGDRTYIKYTATLREEASGEAFRTLPVTYYHVTADALTSDEAKSNAEKNMIRLSIKNVFAKLYGMENVPEDIQTHFYTNDIFAELDESATKPATKKPVALLKAKPVVAAQVTTTPEPVIVAPDEAIIESTSTDGGPVVLKCVVC